VNANRVISYQSDRVVTLRERRRAGRLRELFSFSTVWATGWITEGPCFDSWQERVMLLLQSVQTAPASTQRLVVIRGDFSQGVQRLGREADYPPPSVFRVSEWNCASSCPYVFITCTGRNWTLSLLKSSYRSLALGFEVKSFDRYGHLNVSAL
jgi:hypothetical protein